MHHHNIAPTLPRLTLASLISGLALLTGCSAALVTDPNAPNYVPTPGSKVTVKQRIEVSAGQTRIFLQRGKLITKPSQLDHYWPNCNLEINTLAETSRYIEPGVYTVTRTTRQEKEVVMQQTKHIQLAAVGFGGVLARGDGPAMLFEEVKMTTGISATLRYSQPGLPRGADRSAPGGTAYPGRNPPGTGELRQHCRARGISRVIPGI